MNQLGKHGFGAFGFLQTHPIAKMTDLTFLPMLYIWTDTSSYVKMLSYATKVLIPDIYG